MESFRLYEHSPEPVEVQFDVDGSVTGVVHSYWINGKRRMGVTGITGAIDKSFALIPWALNEAEAFLVANWPQWEPSLEERSALFHSMKKAHEVVRDAAASIGKEAHAWIEEYIHAKMTFLLPPEKPLEKKARSSVEAYLAWESEHNVQYVASERLVYSKIHDFCGTLDLVAYVDGRLSLIDFKTSNDFREEYRVQTAAYLKAYEEEFPLHKIEDRWVLMLKKTSGKFKPIDLGVDTVDRDFECFLHAMGIRKWQDAVRQKKEEIN